MEEFDDNPQWLDGSAESSTNLRAAGPQKSSKAPSLAQKIPSTDHGTPAQSIRAPPIKHSVNR